MLLPELSSLLCLVCSLPESLCTASLKEYDSEYGHDAVLQYKGLAELQDKYSSQGFDVFAFPCNQVRTCSSPGDRCSASPSVPRMCCCSMCTAMFVLWSNHDGLVSSCVCLQFGKQEPADNPAIKKFAEGKGFNGPVFAKVDVNGAKGG